MAAPEQAEDNYFCDTPEGTPEPQPSLWPQAAVAAAVMCTAKLAGDQLFEVGAGVCGGVRVCGCGCV